MILTVTPNTALDRILFIDEWTTGTPMRTRKVVTSVGGKGLDSSVVLRHLGVETVGLCFVAGKVGQELLDLINGYGIIPDPIWVNGDTRIAHVISELKHHRHSHVITGELIVTDQNVADFLNRFRQLVTQAVWIICAGTIPSGMKASFYGEITDIANQAGVPTLIDSSKDYILQALPDKPSIVKMNWEEFQWTFQREANNISELIQHAHQVYKDMQLNALVLTLGINGILAFSKDGNYLVSPPIQQAVNAAGAGDAVSSALTWRLSLGDTWEQALRWGAATSAAVVLTEGTADCHMEDILRIMPEVVVNRFNT